MVMDDRERAEYLRMWADEIDPQEPPAKAQPVVVRVSVWAPAPPSQSGPHTVCVAQQDVVLDNELTYELHPFVGNNAHCVGIRRLS